MELISGIGIGLLSGAAWYWFGRALSEGRNAQEDCPLWDTYAELGLLAVIAIAILAK